MGKSPTKPEPTADTDWRAHLARLVESRRFEAVILVLILVNAVVLGLETTPFGARHLALLGHVDRLLLGAFVIELLAKMVVYGARFPRDPWRVFDFLVVAIALVPATGALSVLRALRVLRVLRLITMVPTLRRVVGGLLSAIPGLSAIIAIMALIFYVGAVISTKLFGADFPEWFGSIGRSAYTLFQVMTLESWSMGIVRPVMEKHPVAWAFFIPYILVATFTMLNLFIAVIVNALQSQAQEELDHAVETLEEDSHADRDRILTEVQGLRREIEALRRELAGSRG